MAPEQIIQFAEQSFSVLGKALFWPKESMLILADVHLGKARHFQKEGLPVTHAVEEKNLERINAAIHGSQARQILFLGDLFHSEANEMNDRFSTWLRSHSEEREFILVKGNHDVHNSFRDERLEVVEEIEVAGVLLCHEPRDRAELPFICGHLHPAVRFKGKGRQRLTLPAFIQDEQKLIMPAFGEFTGLHVMSISKGQQAIPVLEEAGLHS